MQTQPLKLNKYIDSLISEHNEQNKKVREIDSDRLEFSIMSNFSNKSCNNYKIINDYILAFTKNKESRNKLLDERKILSKVISILLCENFEFINTSDLLRFCYISVKDDLIDSSSFKSLVLATYFKIVECELGSPSFESSKVIHSLLSLVNIIRNKNNPLYFDWKVFKSFSNVFQKNNLLYLEDQKIVEELFLTLLNNYIDLIDSIIEYADKSHLKVTKTAVINNPEFFSVMYFGFKPFYLQYFISNEAFKCLMSEFSQQIVYIQQNIKKLTGVHLKLFTDVILTFLLFYRYKSLRPLLNIEKDKIALFILEYINQLLFYQKTQEILSFIEFSPTLFEDMLKRHYTYQKPKKKFLAIKKELEMNMFKISSKDSLFKKSFIFNFCNKIFNPYTS